ncbi:astacin-like metalloendopeptidase [Tamandua tetradactyla]|uniref:astacin-like metalloendopeptidase n=1 Tax=Tamandua tetradactyla TaxID=48850 RepID=UPI0040538E87
MTQASPWYTADAQEMRVPDGPRGKGFQVCAGMQVCAGVQVCGCVDVQVCAGVQVCGRAAGPGMGRPARRLSGLGGCRTLSHVPLLLETPHQAQRGPRRTAAVTQAQASLTVCWRVWGVPKSRPTLQAPGLQDASPGEASYGTFPELRTCGCEVSRVGSLLLGSRAAVGSMGGVWPWVLALLFLPGSLLGAPAASSCPGRDSNFPEELSAKGTQRAWDVDIPAINRGLIPEETPEGSFLLEGDIIRPSPFRLLSAASSRWPKSGGLVEVPFLLSSKYDELSRRVILAAFAEFEHSTCVRFVPYEGQRDFISIVPMSGCFSGVGRSGGLQVVSLAPACLRTGPGIALHELMHVLGFWHEHARADRDRYIRVDWREILPGFEINFIKSRSSNMLAPYDYASVLHYGRLAFSRRGAPTIVPLRDPRAHLGQRRNLSASDVTRVLRLYACGSPPGGCTPDPGSMAHPLLLWDSGPWLHLLPAPGPPSHAPASGLHLQRLLKALAEPRAPHPGGSWPGGQRVAAAAGESPAGRGPAVLKSGREAPARLPQAPSSRLKARVPGTTLVQSWPARAPTVPQTPTVPQALEAGGQLAPV